MFEKIETGFKKVQNVLLAILAIALAAMAIVIMVQTLTRYVIFYSLPWSEELSRYLFIFIVMIGLNLAITDNMLINIDLLDRALEGKPFGKIIELVRLIIAFAVSVIIAYNCQKLFFIGSIQRSPAMEIPMIIMYGIIFAGYIFAAIALIFKIIETIKKVPEKGKEDE